MQLSEFIWIYEGQENKTQNNINKDVIKGMETFLGKVIKQKPLE